VVLLLLVSIKDLPIPLVANFIPEDVLTVISRGKNVKYMIPRGYPHYSGQVSIPRIPISHIKKIEPFFLNLRLNQRPLYPGLSLGNIFVKIGAGPFKVFESRNLQPIPFETSQE